MKPLINKYVEKPISFTVPTPNVPQMPVFNCPPISITGPLISMPPLILDGIPSNITIPSFISFTIPSFTTTGFYSNVGIPSIIGGSYPPSITITSCNIPSYISTQEKSEAILRKVVEIINKGDKVAFEEDFGGNTATIYRGEKHTHVGIPDGSFEVMVNNLYDLLCKGEGLSWA